MSLENSLYISPLTRRRIDVGGLYHSDRMESRPTTGGRGYGTAGLPGHDGAGSFPFRTNRQWSGRLQRRPHAALTSARISLAPVAIHSPTAKSPAALADSTAATTRAMKLSKGRGWRAGADALKIASAISVSLSSVWSGRAGKLQQPCSAAPFLRQIQDCAEPGLMSIPTRKRNRASPEVSATALPWSCSKLRGVAASGRPTR